MSVGQEFDRSAESYDSWMRLALPSYNEIFLTALEIMPFEVDKATEVLDLGAGTGLFSWHVFGKYPQARFVLCDLAPRMLEVAEGRFKGHEDQFEYIVGDYREYKSARRFDLVISSLSIHHLTDEEKRKLFGEVYRVLRDGGVFVNIDQIKGPTPDLVDLYWENWLGKVRAAEAPEEQIQASIQRRTKYDHDASLVDQLNWLSEAGFVNVDCVYKNFFIGVFYASKSSHEPSSTGW
jgi:tRNA (cmo5U34)-methyltransferase